MSTILFRRGESSINHLLIFDFCSAACRQTCFPVRPCRVFVLADPDVFSGSLGQVLLGDIEASGASGRSLGPLDHMRCVVQHSLQAALGAERCHGQRLAQALKVGVAVQLSARSLCFVVVAVNKHIAALSVHCVSQPTARLVGLFHSDELCLHSHGSVFFTECGCCCRSA